MRGSGGRPPVGDGGAEARGGVSGQEGGKSTPEKGLEKEGPRGSGVLGRAGVGL